MSKHTEGPWKLLKFDDNENYVVTNQSGREGFHREIATVAFGYSEPAETEQHANAKLIAAAPELLEALGEALATGCLNGALEQSAREAYENATR